MASQSIFEEEPLPTTQKLLRTDPETEADVKALKAMIADLELGIIRPASTYLGLRPDGKSYEADDSPCLFSYARQRRDTSRFVFPEHKWPLVTYGSVVHDILRCPFNIPFDTTVSEGEGGSFVRKQNLHDILAEYWEAALGFPYDNAPDIMDHPQYSELLEPAATALLRIALPLLLKSDALNPLDTDPESMLQADLINARETLWHHINAPKIDYVAQHTVLSPQESSALKRIIKVWETQNDARAHRNTLCTGELASDDEWILV
ncbi:hypothetical protein H2200_003119 [Cladophialophora chaetospira]|uniref:Uncharacterized protein n=1 Tax=Cladophialophora chaetospira TaxID=386627 RepID=A0AA38XGQ8_9EURO|nr:hypothetical protein H2200_003119 [Cladophialophora chaetospira]